MNSKKFDEDFIKFLISSKESNTLDFKQKITSREKISKTLAALANTEGGFILVGLSDNKTIVGIDPEEEKYMIESANEMYCIPRVSISFEHLVQSETDGDKKNQEEKFLLLVSIKKTEGPKIYVKDKAGNLKFYVRRGDQTRLIP
jgi:predicted HTH transcriptional regulator